MKRDVGASTSRALVRDQHGMLTLDATGTSGTVSATARPATAAATAGWEARVRAEQYTSDGTPYHVVWELVPTSGYHCGARSIVLSDYALGTSTTHDVPPQRCRTATSRASRTG